MDDRGLIRDSQYGFTKGKLCLSNLVAFHNAVVASADQKRAMDVIYLDICNVFDTVPHTILAAELEKHRLEGGTAR